MFNSWKAIVVVVMRLERAACGGKRVFTGRGTVSNRAQLRREGREYYCLEEKK